MAAGSVATDHEAPGANDHGVHDPVHGHADHDDDHGHDAHGPADDVWVLLPVVVGLVIGLIVALVFGLASGVSPL
jgi:hypothetical protein